ncbi:MAG: stage III sporulation protein AB [Clostridia bacterium]|nr:stage III sporulation protein AB [Clostridia bacterium]
MFKLFGALCIVIAGASFGFLKSYMMKKRIESLSSFLLAFKKISAEISFTRHRAERVFTDISKELKMPIFYDAALLIKSKGLKAAWEYALNSHKPNMALSDKDIATINKFSSSLEYTGEEQKRSVDTVIKLTSLLLTEAEKSYEKEGRLFRSAGCLVSVLIAILLY